MGVKTGGRYYRLVHNRPGQQPALEIWQGEEALALAAQQALYRRARCNRAARRGEYNAAMETSSMSIPRLAKLAA